MIECKHGYKIRYFSCEYCAPKLDEKRRSEMMEILSRTCREPENPTPRYGPTREMLEAQNELQHRAMEFINALVDKVCELERTNAERVKVNAQCDKDKP